MRTLAASPTVLTLIAGSIARGAPSLEKPESGTFGPLP